MDCGSFVALLSGATGFCGLPMVAVDLEKRLLMGVSSTFEHLYPGRFSVANLAYWVTGTEGSNPSLSASFIGFSPI